MKKSKGFTLIELLITMAIVALLIKVAYPSYVSYLTQARRADGKGPLLNMATLMERYYTDNNTYVGATLANIGLSNPTPSGYYNLQITSNTATTYSIQAVPIGAQATNDTQCATFTLDQLGTRGETGTGTVADCW